MQAGKGLHGSKTPNVYAPADLTGRGNESRVASYIPALTAKTTVGAVVQHCFSASSFKVYIPSQDCLLSFSLAAVRTGRRQPRVARAAVSKVEGGAEEVDAPSPPSAAAASPARRYVDLDLDAYGLEAWNFVRKHAHMRDVELEVAGVDNRGMCSGALFVPVNGVRTNISVRTACSSLCVELLSSR